MLVSKGLHIYQRNENYTKMQNPKFHCGKKKKVMKVKGQTPTPWEAIAQFGTSKYENFCPFLNRFTGHFGSVAVFLRLLQDDWDFYSGDCVCMAGEDY